MAIWINYRNCYKDIHKDRCQPLTPPNIFPTKNNLSFHIMIELSIEICFRNSIKIDVFTMILCYYMAQVTAEFLPIVVIIFQQLKTNNIYWWNCDYLHSWSYLDSTCEWPTLFDISAHHSLLPNFGTGVISVQMDMKISRNAMHFKVTLLNIYRWYYSYWIFCSPFSNLFLLCWCKEIWRNNNINIFLIH